jgi:hypothetical protein
MICNTNPNPSKGKEGMGKGVGRGGRPHRLILLHQLVLILRRPVPAEISGPNILTLCINVHFRVPRSSLL